MCSLSECSVPEGRGRFLFYHPHILGEKAPKQLILIVYTHVAIQYIYIDPVTTFRSEQPNTSLKLQRLRRMVLRPCSDAVGK